MDFWILLILAAFAIPVCAVAGLVIAVQSRSRIEILERRILTLEREATHRPYVHPSPASAADPAKPAAAEPAPAAPTQPAKAPAEAARTAVPPVAPPKPEQPGRSLEQLIGGRWSVIVGGLALALGGIFLVRYSIEQGLLGPAARVTLGALFSAGLLILGERMRRTEARAGRPRRPIDIPAVVTAAGASSAFATVYASYALYNFLPPAIAFVLLGVVAVATMVAAVLHGPALGALGLIGGYAAPLLVSSNEPNVWALLTYLLAPTAAAFAVARIRGWAFLAIGAGAAAFLWGAIAIFGGLADDAAPILLYALALTALAAATHSSASPVAPEPRAIPDYVSSGLIAAFGLLAAVAPPLSGYSTVALVICGAILIAQFGLGVWAAGLAPAAAAAGLLAGVAALAFDDAALAAVAEITSFPDPGETARSAGVGAFMTFCGAMGLAFLGGGAAGARLRPASPPWWSGLLAAAAAGTPLLLLALSYWKVSEFEPDIRFATIAVLLAAALAWLAEDAARREANGAASPMATAAFATGSAAALGLALAMAWREGALTVALAFLAMALGFVATRRNIRALGWLAIAAAAIVLVRIAIDPRIVGDNLGTTPIFNALLWGYGAPALAFWLGARWFAKAGQTLPATALEALSLLFALLLGFTQARHLAHGGDMTAPGVALIEAGLDATVAFGLAAVTGRLGIGRLSPALRWGSLAASGLGAFVSVFGLLLAANPAFTGEPVGGAVLNDLLPGYLLPALAAFAAARLSGPDRPAWVCRALGGAALVLAFAYLTLMVRRAFAGEFLDGPFATDAELWAYSVVWLLFGLALLAVGVIRRSQVLRIGSGVVIVLVIIKVFLFDLAGVGGVWRALSFIGLGGVLVGVGFVYQRLLTPAAAKA